MPFTQAPALPDPNDPETFNPRALAAWAWLAKFASELSAMIPAESAAALAQNLAGATAGQGAALLGYSDAVSYPVGSAGAAIAARGAAAGVAFTGTGGEPETVNDALTRQWRMRRGDISPLMTRYGASVVITGDSLSFNAYDFDGTLLPAGNAYDNAPGLMSWAHMLRDAIYASDPFFVPADRLVISGEEGAMNNAAAYTVPFNNVFREVLGTASTAVGISLSGNVPTSSGNKHVLLFSKNPNSNRAGSVDIYVDGAFSQTLNLNGAGANFQGFEMVTALVGNGAIELRNFKNPDGTDASSQVAVLLLGVSHINASVRMTGHGGWKASQILSDFTARIGQYAPDVLFLIIGANDIHTDRTPAQFFSDLVSIVTQTRALKPGCEIVLISSPPCSTNNAETRTTVIPWANQPVYAWLKKMEQVAATYNCFYIDLYELLQGVPASSWRYDNIHFTKYGNNLVYRYIKSRVFPSMPEPRNVILDANYSKAPDNGVPYIEADFNAAVLTYNSTTGWSVTNDPSGIVKKAYKPGANNYEVQVDFSKSHYMVSFEHISGGTTSFVSRPLDSIYSGSNTGYEKRQIFNLLASPPANATNTQLNGSTWLVKFARRR